MIQKFIFFGKCAFILLYFADFHDILVYHIVILVNCLPTLLYWTQDARSLTMLPCKEYGRSASEVRYWTACLCLEFVTIPAAASQDKSYYWRRAAVNIVYMDGGILTFDKRIYMSTDKKMFYFFLFQLKIMDEKQGLIVFIVGLERYRKIW